GFGPFVRATRNESLLLLQAFMGVTSVMTLALAALVAERSQVEERLRQLAVSDPLTGLANYRQLTYAIDAEIKRYQRTERPFAVVLPGTDDAAAWHVARRISERVARDGEKPPLSVSVGVAVYPRDGDSLDTLLSAADRSLYDSKARRRAKARVH